MSSTTAGGAVVEYYSSVPTFIPPASYSSTGVPTFTPTNTPSPQQTIQDLSSPPSSNHAHPTTPSPPPEASNPYANDPWAPQANQSIKVDSLPPPKSPNLGPQRKMHSKFAVPAPSTGAAGYSRRAATEYSTPTSPLASPGTGPEGLGLTSPVPALSVTPSAASANAAGTAKNTKTGVSKDSLSKSFARLSLSLSGRSKSGKKNSPPADEPAPRLPQPSSSNGSNLPLPSQHSRPVSFAGSPAPSVRPRSFVIPQTLEEWEAFNKAVLTRPPASHQRPPPPPPQSNRLRPPSSGPGMLPGPRLAASLAASPLNSPGASPRRSVVDLPPPPIVLGEWERKRLSEAQGIPFPQAPTPPQQQQPQQQQPTSQRPAPAKRQTTEGTPSASPPSSRPTTPPTESRRNSLFFMKRTSSGAVSPSAANASPMPIPKPSQQPTQVEHSPLPSRVSSPQPVPLAAAVSSPALVEQPSPDFAPIVRPAKQQESAEPETENEPVEAPAAPLSRLRTVSLPGGPDAKNERPHLAIETDVSSPSLRWSRPKSWMGVMGGGNGGDSRSRRNSVSEGDMGDVRPRVVSIERRYNPDSNGARLRALRRSSRGSSIDLTTSGSAAAKDADDKRSLMSEGGRIRNLLKKKRRSSASESDAEGGLADAGKLKKKSQPQQPAGSMGLPPGAARPLLGTNYAVSPGAVSPSPAPEEAATTSSTQEKRRSRRFSFGLKNFSGAVQPAAAVASPSPPANNSEADLVPNPARAAAPAPVASATPTAEFATPSRARLFSFGMKNSSTAQLVPAPYPANNAEVDAAPAPAAAAPPAHVASATIARADVATPARARLFSFGTKNSSTAQLVPSPFPANEVASPATSTVGKSRGFSFGVKNPAAPAPANDVEGDNQQAEKTRSRRFSFGIKNAAAAQSPSPANDVEGDGQQAPRDGEKTRSRRFSFGLKNAAATPSSANNAEGDGQQASNGEKRRSRRFSFSMKNPFGKSESSSASPAPGPAVNPHALLPPGAARPAIPSRAGSQGTTDTPFSSSNASSAATTPAVADSSASSMKPPSPPPPSSPLALSALAMSRSANNSSASLTSKMNPFKRKPPPSISDEPFVIVPTLNKGKGQLKLEISEAEKERLERMSAPPSLPNSRPQTPSDNTIPVRSFGPGKRGSFFADDDDKEERIDEKNNRVSRFLNDYAANNELGLAIPSPSLRGMPLAPPSMTDTTDNSLAATDSTGHSDGTARVRTPERFEY
ncbi:hypothetical protein FS837_007998 [Tulasnella sp. UAMH 9824]|nr:hypothetical protein FS837_007998 [Tulasnella sp. UAMH 9824]